VAEDAETEGVGGAMDVHYSLSEDQLEEVHEFLFNALVGLGVIHVLGALKHYFIDRDDVLRVMLPHRR
jgi:cytochrome b561